MSGYADADGREQGALVPGLAYLSKPFTAAALGAKLREVLTSG